MAPTYYKGVIGREHQDATLPTARSTAHQDANAANRMRSDSAKKCTLQTRGEVESQLANRTGAQ